MRGPLVAIAVVAAIACGAVTAVLLDGGSEELPKFDGMVHQLLTDSDRAEARRVASESRELRRILDGHPFAVESIGVWDGYVLNRAPELPDVVTVVRLRLDPSVPRLRAQWPFVGDLRPCRRLWFPMIVSDLREVLVYVHMDESRAAFIVPGQSGDMSSWAVPPRFDSSCRSR